MPKISIIVPIYNVEAYLNPCIDSIISQTFTDFECILVDDGSPDNCPQMCDEYAQKDKRIKVIHKPNGGVSSARNAGIDIASGEYLMFIDGDDYYSADILETMLKEISTGVDIVACNYVSVSESNEFLWNRGYEPNDYEFDTQQEWIEFLTNKVLSNDIGWETVNKIFKKSIIDDKKIRFNEDAAIGEDLFFFMEYMLNVNSLRTIEYDGYYYVIHGDSATRTNNQSKINDFVNMNYHLYNVICREKYVFLRKKYYLLFYALMNIRYMPTEFPTTLNDIKNIHRKAFYRKNTLKIILNAGEVFNHQKRDTKRGILAENLYYYAYASNKMVRNILLKLLRR